MDKRLVRKIINHIDRGDRVLFGVDHFGSVRIKVKYGLFKILTTYHRTDQDTFNAIQAKLAIAEDGPDPTLNAPCELAEEGPQLPDLEMQYPEPTWWVEDAARPTIGAHTPEHAPEPKALCPRFIDHLTQNEGGASAHWKAYSKAYRRKRDQDRFTRLVEAEEIESLHHALSSIDEAWNGLLSGSLPALARDVWQNMHPKRPVHLLAEELQVPLRDCVFWLCVFKRHMGVELDAHHGIYQFRRTTDIDDLASAIQTRYLPATLGSPDEVINYVYREPRRMPLRQSAVD